MSKLIIFMQISTFSLVFVLQLVLILTRFAHITLQRGLFLLPNHRTNAELTFSVQDKPVSLVTVAKYTPERALGGQWCTLHVWEPTSRDKCEHKGCTFIPHVWIRTGAKFPSNPHYYLPTPETYRQDLLYQAYRYLYSICLQLKTSLNWLSQFTQMHTFGVLECKARLQNNNNSNRTSV